MNFIVTKQGERYIIIYRNIVINAGLAFDVTSE